ncbi:hypothetical protein Q7C36_009921 [Tachysurus vachellii]|uniref:Retrotransposon gag domain-containing protein n=1 Tax=Tachysurus vachellii TaxID=175792 RepID=A0AA88MYZ2_TACVA|nr:hypothetical protein Q7C36_009921 [Tachysurus vachellii]
MQPQPSPSSDTVRNLISALQTAFPSAAAHQNPPTPTGSSMALPATFSGEAAECRGFLLQVSLYVEMHPPRFPTERAKVAFIISLFSGRALAWAQSLWEAGSPITTTYAAFTTHFREVFCAASGTLSAADQLLRIRQGRDCITEYSLRFRTLAASIGWNKTALLSVYRRGLAPEIQQAMAVHDDSVGLEEFIQRSIGLFQRLAACPHTPPQVTGTSSLASYPDPEPIQLVNVQPVMNPPLTSALMGESVVRRTGKSTAGQHSNIHHFPRSLGAGTVSSIVGSTVVA